MDMLVTPQSGAAEPSSGKMPLSQILKTLRRNLWVILLCGIIAAAAAFGFSKTRPHLYTANAAIAIESQSFGVPELAGAIHNDDPAEPMPIVLTEMQAITSREVVQLPTSGSIGFPSSIRRCDRPPSSTPSRRVSRRCSLSHCRQRRRPTGACRACLRRY
jgi:hypothetical protein